MGENRRRGSRAQFRRSGVGAAAGYRAVGGSFSLLGRSGVRVPAADGGGERQRAVDAKLQLLDKQSN